MAYDDQKVKSGAQPVWIMELDMDTCTNTYGIVPCTADGPQSLSCFNCFSTCQDEPNYNKGTKTFRFASIRIDELQRDNGGPPTFPTIMGVNTAPTQLTPGKGFGIRSTVNVQLTDHPYTDIGIDNQYEDRDYDPANQGSFWGKFLAREQYYEGREMRIMTGYLNDDGTYQADNFITRTYFIDTISGPSPDGKVTVTGKDILKFADSEKAQLPDQSQAELVSDITDAQTSFDITDPQDNVKNAYDGGQAYIRVDDETMLITNLTGTNPTYTLTVTRAAMPSYYKGTMEADEHSSESTVQDCYNFVNESVNDILEYLLKDITGIPASFLDLTGWQEVINFGFQNYFFSTLLTEPTGIKDLVTEITEHNFLVWYDERDQKVKMDSIINTGQTGASFTDDDSIVDKSVSIGRDDDSRVTQTWFVFGHRNPVLEMDEIKNFTTVNVTADLDAEGPNEYNLKKVKRIWSRWLTNADGAIASEITNRYNNYYKVTKKILALTLTPKDDSTWTGDIVTASTRQVQDVFGNSESNLYRVLEVSEVLKPGSVSYKYVMESTDQDTDRVGNIAPNSQVEYDSATDEEKELYAFIAADDRGDGEPGFPPTDPPYLIV